MLARAISGVRTYSPAALLYLTAVTMTGFAVDGGVYSVLFNLYLNRLGFGPEMIGIISGAAQLTFAISSLPAGALGARFGIHRMLVVGMALMAVGCVLLPLADVVPAELQLPWLLGNELLLYFGLALYFVNGAPFLLSIVAPAQRSQVFGIQSAIFAVSAFAGGLVGGFLPGVFADLTDTTLLSPAPYRYPLMIAGLGLLPAVFAINAARGGALVAEVPVSESDAPTAHPSMIAPSVIVTAIVMMGIVRMFQVSGLAATSSYFNLYLDQGLGVATVQIGTIAACMRLLSAPAGLLTPRLMRRFGGFGVVLAATLGTCLAILPMAFVPHWAAAGLSLGCVVGLASIRYASSVVYFLELVPPERRATVSGVTEMAAGLSFTVIVFAGGYIIGGVGYQALFLFGAALTLIGGLLFWWYFRRFQRG
jgi:MFS family permease